MILRGATGPEPPAVAVGRGAARVTIDEGGASVNRQAAGGKPARYGGRFRPGF
jgi:hypothetical protein